MPKAKTQPWKPSDATSIINSIAKDGGCTLSYTAHAKERMKQRDLFVSDLLFVMRKGYVYADPEKSTVQGFYKYRVEGQSPNSGSRTLRVVVVPDQASCQLKVITIMWRDE